jgi:cytochrome P450
MPFSLGRRQCLGESLARTELFMIFVTLLQMYTWHAPDGVDVHACMKPRYRFTRHPSPYEMIFERRHL